MMRDDLDKDIARFNLGGPVRDRSAYSGSDLLLERVIARDRRRGEEIEQAESRLRAAAEKAGVTWAGSDTDDHIAEALLCKGQENELLGLRLFGAQTALGLHKAAAERLAQFIRNLCWRLSPPVDVSPTRLLREAEAALAAGAAAPDRKHGALLDVAEAGETLDLADRAELARGELEDEAARAATFDALCEAWTAFRLKLTSLKEA